MIEEPPIRRLSATTNATVVQLPERASPGFVVQGDSLRNLVHLLEEAQQLLRAGDSRDGEEIVEEASGILRGYLAAYDSALAGDTADNAGA